MEILHAAIALVLGATALASGQLAKVATCPRPTTPMNGFMMPLKDAYDVGKTVVFFCPFGFRLAGAKRRVCRHDGTWSLTVPSCVAIAAKINSTMQPKAIQCKRQGELDYGQMIPRKNYYDIGETIRFSCDYQYRLYGFDEAVCLNDGTWSMLKPSCYIDHCDDIEAAEPDHGRRNGTHFIGGSYEYSCNQGYTLAGNKRITCLGNGIWSAAPPLCEDVCNSHSCGFGEKCVYAEESDGPICACKFNLDCPADYNPVCGSDGNTYNSECIMAATACRQRKAIRSVAKKICQPGGLCTIQPNSSCRAHFSVFYFNLASKQCEEMIAGGCHKSGWNGFFNRKACEKTCLGSICQLPLKKGPCDNLRTRWGLDATTNKCVPFQFGGCFGNQNNFASETACRQFCGIGASDGNTKANSSCKICDGAVSTVCQAMKKLDYVIIGKILKDDSKEVKLFVNAVVFDLEQKIRLYKEMTILKDQSHCNCTPDIPIGDVILAGKYSPGTNYRPVFGAESFASLFTDVGQFAAC